VIFHQHRIIPGHMGGEYTPNNVIRVNIALHAFLHRCLWETHGRVEDFVAWKGLSGEIGKDEWIRVRTKLGALKRIGHKNSAATKHKRRQSCLAAAKRGPDHHWFGKKHPDSTLRQMRVSAVKRTTPEYRQALSDGAKRMWARRKAKVA
jgi:hypothetical protein